MTPTAPLPDTPLALQTLSPSGKPPKRRIATPGDARSIFWVLKDSNRVRLENARVIQAMFDGAPPYNPVKRRQLGQAWMPNFNSLEGQSRLEAAKTPFYDLFSSTPTFAEIECTEGTPDLDATECSNIVTAEFQKLLDSYSGFHLEMWTMLTDYIGFNRGFLWYPNPETPRFRRIPWSRVLFPDGTSCNPDEWDCFVVEQHWPVHRLWKEATLGLPGWDREAVVRAIRAAVPDDLARGNGYDDPMRLQQALRDNDLWLSSRSAKVHTGSIYVREFDGSWSCMMVEVDQGNGQKPAPGGVATSRVDRASGALTPETAASGNYPVVALYTRDKLAKSLSHIMQPFIFEANDGSINELSGLGKRIVSLVQASDRMLNEMVGNAFMSSTIVLKAQTGGGQHKTATVRLGGGICTLPPNYEVVPGNSLFGNMEGTLGMSSHLANVLDRNTGIYRPQFEKPRGNPESATAANIRFSQATVLTNSAVNRFYVQLDQLVAELLRRASQSVPSTSPDPGVRDIAAFQQACKERGVPRKVIESAVARATRAIGNGSPVMRQQVMAQLAQLVPFMGPRGLLNWKRDYATAQAGSRAALRYFPVEDTAKVPTRDDWDASQENADMNQGNQAVFAEWQNSEIHAQVHLAAGFAAVQAVVEGGADPATPFTFLQTAMPHIAEHISKVPREQVRKELEAAYQQLGKGFQQVMQAAQKQLEQQGQQQQLSFEQQLKMQELQADVQLKQVKNQEQMRQRQERHQLDMQQKQQQAATEAQGKQQQAALADATTAADVTRKAAQTQADIEMQRAKVQADIEAQRAKAAAAAQKPAGGAS